MNHSLAKSPWYITRESSRWTLAKEDIYIIRADDFGEIAFAVGIENARLMTLAPKMLEALSLIGNACRVQANLLSTATQPERDRFIASVFNAWNELIAPALENGILEFRDNALTVNEKQLANS